MVHASSTESTRQRAYALVAQAYTSITAEDFAAFVGYTVEEAVKGKHEFIQPLLTGNVLSTQSLLIKRSKEVFQSNYSSCSQAVFPLGCVATYFHYLIINTFNSLASESTDMTILCSPPPPSLVFAQRCCEPRLASRPRYQNGDAQETR